MSHQTPHEHLRRGSTTWDPVARAYVTWHGSRSPDPKPSGTSRTEARR